MRTKWLDEDGDPLTSSRLAGVDLLIVGMNWISNLLSATEAFIESVGSLTRQHSNWTADLDNFHEEVTHSIETLAGGGSA